MSVVSRTGRFAGRSRWSGAGAALAVVAGALALVGPAATPAQAATPEGCFTFAAGTISGYDAATCGTSVSIPGTIGGVQVTAIGNSAFAGKAMVSVTIPNTVVSIGASAFAQSGNVTSATLTSLVLGSSVTTIGNYAFG
ncbi:MAG: leucine-rich repeat domain-containing protein, partial [Actinomycetes bacterium]